MGEESDLETIRREIDALDAKLLQLIAERARLVLSVGEFKRENNLAVYDPERERHVLDQLTRDAPAPLTAGSVRRIFERLIDESRRIEQQHVAKSRAE